MIQFVMLPGMMLERIASEDTLRTALKPVQGDGFLRGSVNVFLDEYQGEGIAKLAMEYTEGCIRTAGYEWRIKPFMIEINPAEHPDWDIDPGDSLGQVIDDSDLLGPAGVDLFNLIRNDPRSLLT